MVNHVGLERQSSLPFRNTIFGDQNLAIELYIANIYQSTCPIDSIRSGIRISYSEQIVRKILQKIKQAQRAKQVQIDT